MSETVTYATQITDLSEKKLTDKQMRLAVMLAEMFEKPQGDPAMMAVRVIDTIREFNAAERRAKETGQPKKPKVPTVPVPPLIEKLAVLLSGVPHAEEEYAAGLVRAIEIIKDMAGVE